LLLLRFLPIRLGIDHLVFMLLAKIREAAGAESFEAMGFE
jgi:hypothetical protein